MRHMTVQFGLRSVRRKFAGPGHGPIWTRSHLDTVIAARKCPYVSKVHMGFLGAHLRQSVLLWSSTLRTW